MLWADDVRPKNERLDISGCVSEYGECGRGIIYLAILYCCKYYSSSNDDLYFWKDVGVSGDGGIIVVLVSWKGNMKEGRPNAFINNHDGY